MKSKLMVAAAVMLFTFCSGAAEKALTLVEKGQPKATIVISKDAPVKNKLAASELQAYLKKITGAELPIATDDKDIKGTKILVGRSSLTDALKINIPTGYSFDEIKEGYMMKTVGGNLVLAGNDDGFPSNTKYNPKRPYSVIGEDGHYSGSLFAVYDFLERLGCRWYMPGDIGEVVPKMDTVSVGPMDVNEKPYFMFRGYWSKPNGQQADIESDAFFNRNRFISFSAGFSNATDGSLNHLIFGKSAKEMFEKHPEYFGLKEDLKTRSEHAVCMSNPEVIKLVIEKSREFFQKNPNAMYVGFAPVDGEPNCWCEKCKEINGQIQVPCGWRAGEMPCISGTYYNLVNEVAKALKPEFPDKVIAASIYAGRVLPPPSEFKFESNVGGHLALIEYSLMRPMDTPDNWEAETIAALFRSWKKRMDKFVYRPYYPTFMLHNGLPIPMMRNIISDAKFLAKPENKPFGVRWESWPAYNTLYVNTYVWGKMLWNPNQDGDALLKDFYEKFYGPAAKPMEKFYTALEEAIRNAPFNTHEEELLPEIYSNKFVKGLMPLIDEAEKAVANADESYKKRVGLARLTADHMLRYSEMRDINERNFEYSKAAEKADEMLKIEEEMNKLNANYIFTTHYKYDQKPGYGLYGANFTAVGKKIQYTNINKLMNGESGELAVNMPRRWKFRTDVVSLGLPAGWFDKGADLSKWSDAEMGRCLEVQGYYTDKKALIPYLGEAWYATDFELPPKFDGRELGLFVGGINNEAWIWLNGQMFAYQPFHTWWMRPAYSWTKNIPAGLLKPGKNRIAVRVKAGDKFGFGGMFRNMFIYAPTAKEAGK